MIIFSKEELSKYNEDVKDEEISDIISILEKEFEIIKRLNGNAIGLAAPQIGIHKKAAIIRLSHKPYYEYNVDLINPKIIKFYDIKTFENEGCLSFPGININTQRYNEIVVENYSGNIVATGILSIAIQHEIDHLNGILFFEREIKKKIKINPNDPCICGKINPITNKAMKYKKCCGV